ncbi:lysophospholipid acyltransferase 2-like isoform X2 [Mya arenaria]|uniref:lysophospholipid acyltransferase 2-like isoform X2 n=1 Tax=Mya arenaria TaxID=6604 RepID=UPI0022DFCE2D|nr:lysophospholipid acyltransferase 2-like isoform X2 [Mya arenaria]XP_052763768.1 lysophospholipid acyltransferase 2-like isoform X2 [Mya arenaria]
MEKSICFLVFFLGEGLCLLCAGLYYMYLPVERVGTRVRHIVALVIGILIGTLSFGWQFCHMYAQTTLCYIAMLILPSSCMHIGVFVLAMGYLVTLHLYRAYMIPEDVLYSIDVSGPVMIVTQKITSLAFSVHDGCYGNKDIMSDLRKRYIVSRQPSLLEYYSYMFYFQGVVVGPLCFYKDYISFVEGADISPKKGKNGLENNNVYQSNRKLSPFNVVVYKLCIALFWLGFHFTFKPVYPEMLNADLEFIRSHVFLYRVWYMLISMLCCRAKYYVAFTLGDAICNASGLGFNGYDSEGNPKWDLITNVSIRGIEGATSFKTYVDNWNIQTATWLRHVCYDRIPVQKRFFTFFLSALWHGCYAGYYFTFVSAVPLSEVARKVRRKIRPYFQTSEGRKMAYNILTWFSTHIVISYMVVPFTILHLGPTFIFYSFNLYWNVHILAVAIFVILRYIPTYKNSAEENITQKELVSTTQNNLHSSFKQQPNASSVKQPDVDILKNE